MRIQWREFNAASVRKSELSEWILFRSVSLEPWNGALATIFVAHLLNDQFFKLSPIFQI